MYANIIPLTKLPLSRLQSYTYDVADFANEIKFGQIVDIRLYNQKTTGVVVSIFDQLPADANKDIIYKKILGIADPIPFIHEKDLALAELVSDYYFASLGLIFKFSLPKPLKRKSAKFEKAMDSLDLKLAGNFSAGKNLRKPKIILGTNQQRQKKYFEIIKKVIAEKKQVLLMAPETALLTQMESSLAENFEKKDFLIYHNNLNKTEELIAWRRLQTNDAKIVAGTRQSIFLSFHNLGLIIVNEEADLSYKQWDMNPRYNARHLAQIKAENCGADIIYGGCVPSVKAFVAIKKNKLDQLILLDKKNISDLKIIDMRSELRQQNYSIFSYELHNAIAENLAAKKQILIFVNRRAAATFVMCRDCGHVLRCPNCDIALIEHLSKTLTCGHCSVKMISPLKCPRCSSERIKGFGIGIERVVEEFKKLFPGASIQRLDASENSQYKNLSNNTANWRHNRADVLIGTQISIRLNAENLGLVAALNIDSILNFPDWHNDEKAWQILHSLARQTNAVSVIFQTYKPDAKILTALQKNLNNLNDESFYKNELLMRKKYAYPPYVKMIKLLCKSDDYDYLIKETNRVAQDLKKQLPLLNIIGPNQPINPKIRNFWQKNIVVKLDINQKNAILENILKDLSNSWSIDVDPLT
ncbi:MAG: primosomal protein N' [bacterium]|nr:primosomal protein N' [bacterium]